MSYTGCKVVALYLGPGRSWRASEMFPDGYDLFLKTFIGLEEIVKNDKMVNPFDVIIVHNATDQDDPKHVEMIDSWNNTIVGGKKIIVLHRENKGISFGAYNYAFETFGDKYDYWLFTEDDQLFIDYEYFFAHMLVLHSDPRIAFVPSLGTIEFILDWDPAGTYPCAFGGVGLSSYRFLKEQYDRYGSLANYPDENIDKDGNIGSYSRHYLYSVHGEMEFTKRWIEMGYKVKSYPVFFRASRTPCVDFVYFYMFNALHYKNRSFFDDIRFMEQSL